MIPENETWLINTGGIVIEKKASLGVPSLTDVERAIYCLWVIDYSVRNSGSLGAMEDLYPEALSELNQFARSKQCTKVSEISTFESTTEENEFCENFYKRFDAACAEIRQLYDRP